MGAASTVLVLAGAAVVVLTSERLDGQQRDQLVVAVVAVGVLVALSGWAGVAWRRSPWALQDQGLWRAATTLSYANAAAGLMSAVTLLALGRAAGKPHSVPLAITSCVLLTGLGATLSRGGFLAFGAGALVLVGLLGVRTVIRGAAGPTMGALVALAALGPSIPKFSSARPGLAVAGLVLGAVVASGAHAVSRRALVTAAVAITAVSALVLVAWGPARDAGRQIARPRLSIASPDRVDEARAALRVAGRRPLAGVGPGNADLRWIRSDGAVVVARYAHNEYLQTLADLGVVGLGLLASLLVAVAHMVRRGRAVAPSPVVWAGVAAGLVALGVHGLFDFGWHLPAVPLTGAVLVGIVTTNERRAQP